MKKILMGLVVALGFTTPALAETEYRAGVTINDGTCMVDPSYSNNEYWIDWLGNIHGTVYLDSAYAHHHSGTSLQDRAATCWIDWAIENLEADEDLEFYKNKVEAAVINSETSYNLDQYQCLIDLTPTVIPLEPGNADEWIYDNLDYDDMDTSSCQPQDTQDFFTLISQTHPQNYERLVNDGARECRKYPAFNTNYFSEAIVEDGQIVVSCTRTNYLQPVYDGEIIDHYTWALIPQITLPISNYQ